METSSNKNDKPLILVVNDDGITAPGIRALIGFLKNISELIVVAPNQSMSGMGHAITINSTLRFYKHDGGLGIDEYTSSGTPVDCVKFGTEIAAKGRKVDLVVSGINHGHNYSINVIYSGTMSAALEGAIEGIPSIGFSLDNHNLDADFSACENIVTTIVNQVLIEKQPGLCLNVNIPAVPKEEIKGIKICRQGKGYWQKDFQIRKDPLGKEYYWLSGKFKNEDIDKKDTDIWAMENNYVAVVPTQFDLTDYKSLSSIEKISTEF